MPQITVIKAFKFAHNGCIVEEFEPSDAPRETTQECAELAIAEGWAIAAETALADAAQAQPAVEQSVEQSAEHPTEQAAAEAAPENRDAAHTKRRAR